MHLCASGNPLVVAMSGGVALDFDNTVIFQAVLFTLLLLVLKPLLFDPMLRIFALREERTEGARAEAAALQIKAGELLDRRERERARVAQIAAAERERLRGETARLEAEILKEARGSAGRILEEGRRRVENELSAVRQQLSLESERAARLIVARVLGRELS